MIDRSHALAVTRQAKALNVSRGSVYYMPRPVSAGDLAIMRRIDELHLDYPFAGSRMLRDMLCREGVQVGRRHVATLMKRIGIEAIYRRPNTSKSAPGHKIYPYLLRGLKVDHPNQVWAMDITYLPMARGFVYLAAVVDWFSRRVLAWRLSITMEASFCIEAVEEALAKHGRPEMCKVGDERRTAFQRGRFLVASFRTGRAPFVTHPALQKTGRSQGSSSRRGGIVRLGSNQADIARCSLHARAVS